MVNWYYNSAITTLSGIEIEAPAQHDIRVGMATDQVNALVRNLPAGGVEAVMLRVICRYRRCFQDRDFLIRKCSYAVIHEFFDTLNDGSESIERLSHYFIGILNEYFDELMADGKIQYITAEMRYAIVRKGTEKYPTLCSDYGDKK